MSLEFWAGIECTVNRVQEQYFDQFHKNGHLERIEDIELLAELGVRSIRYPIHWERMAPESPDQPMDWTWSDKRLERLRKNNLNPIVGFLHHGSGPRYTDLLDEKFPEKLAEYARKFAERYPWVRDYTPVNEPLTTARFSALYGHWYPHKKDLSSFAMALCNQIRGTVLSMKAIREINPRARLIQTEDLGKISSTPLLAYQAAFENERRWLSFDLLCGKVNSQHTCWKFFENGGVDLKKVKLAWFAENPCPPDILGINHYITSNRYLSENLGLFPKRFHGGNGKHFYADVEAIRVAEQKWQGPVVLLEEAWKRYQLPLAITEVHLDSTREEQLRWVSDIWQDCERLLKKGIDVRALTAWSVFGAYDWNSLVTQSVGYYEPGVFDLRAKKPRATALARLIRKLAELSHTSANPLEDFKKTLPHPTLHNKGWWHRPTRVLYGPKSADQALMLKGAPLLITGAHGTLGKAFARICQIRGITYRLTTRQEMDIGDLDSVRQALDILKPWAVVNAAGYVRVDEAEQEKELCFRENVSGPVNLAMACEEKKITLMTFSSDLVFDGESAKPYLETDSVSPLNVYGESKAEAERQVLNIHPRSLVVRTSAFFSPWDEHNFVTQSLRALQNGDSIQPACDLIVSPTYLPDLVNHSLNLLIDEEKGVWHLANRGAVSWSDLAILAADRAHLDLSKIQPASYQDLDLLARRPVYSALESEHGQTMPTLETALDHYFMHTQINGAQL